MGYELSGKLVRSGVDSETLEQFKQRYEEFKVKSKNDAEFNSMCRRFENDIKMCELALDGISRSELKLIFYINFCPFGYLHRLTRIVSKEACAFAQLCQFEENAEMLLEKIQKELPPIDEYLDFMDDLMLSLAGENIFERIKVDK